MKLIKNPESKRLLSLFITVALLMTMMTSSMYNVFASEGPPSNVAITDMYSSWASWDILMAENIYNLGNEGTYSNFRGNFTDTKFAPVYESLNKAFGVDSKLNITNKDAVTRGEIISALYVIIDEALILDEDLSAIDYFVKNGLINGRASGNYYLDRKCTTEEMIVFSVRVYEHISYELGLDSAGLFWKITGEDLPNAVYLLGTIHFGDRSIYPLSRAITEAFANAAYLAVEANIYTMSEEDIAYINEIQMLTDGSTIKDYISEETYEIYKAVAESFGIPPEMYDYIKPWAAMLSINEAMLTGGEADDGTDALLGMDMHLLMKAFNFDKNIIEIESIRYQMDLFDSFSPELQEALLLSLITPPPADEGETEYSVEEIAELMRTFMSYLVYAIKSGDEDTLTGFLMASRDYSEPLMREYNTKLWDIRDAAMAETIEQYLHDKDADGDFFVAVGAGHTVGETGIVYVLIEKGYTVERIK